MLLCGDESQVRFDPLQQGGAAVSSASTAAAAPGLLFCTSEGTLGLAAPGSAPKVGLPRQGDGAWQAWGSAAGDGDGGGARALHRSALGASVNSVDVGGHLGADVVAVTDANELVFIRRA